jgi:hypothetical protein
MLTESRLIEMMRDEYRERLTEVMQETDMFDKRDNMIIRKGLKVRHKDTQYEYTVDDVTKDASGEIIVKLKAPDQHRFSVAPEDDKPGEEEIFVIDQEEFEKEYEVK